MLPGAWLVPPQQADTEKKNKKYAPLERQETQAEHKKWKSEHMFRKNNVKSYHFLWQKPTTMEPVPGLNRPYVIT